MTRTEIEKIIKPILQRCLREFGDFSKNGSSDAEFTAYTEWGLRPDVRRVSLMASLAQSVLGDGARGEGLEVGSGHGFLLFPMALLLPHVRWSGVDHPGRSYVRREDFLKTFGDYNCQLVTADIIHEPLPFPNAHFLIVTFSEILEHLPVERLNLVLSEIARVIRPGGVLIASSPNQASLENRLRLLKGKSILAMPNEMDFATGTFGHIRLYTPSEMESAMSKLGFALERCVLESNNSGYRGTSARSWRTRIYRLYERIEQRIGILRDLGDTWYMAFRKG